MNDSSAFSAVLSEESGLCGLTADGFARWEAALRDGLTGLRRRGRLRSAADPAELAAATLALVQGGLLLTQVHRDPDRLRIALDAAWRLLRAEAPARPRQSLRADGTVARPPR